MKIDNDDNDVFLGVVFWQFYSEFYFLLFLQFCVIVLDQIWYLEYFVCVSCGQLFGEIGFYERDGKFFCREDYYVMFVFRCGGCGESIMDSYIFVFSVYWYAECFVCSVSFW